MWRVGVLSIVGLAVSTAAASDAAAERARRVDAVRRTPGFVALWDFVLRREGRFDAWQPAGSRYDLSLDAVNYVREFWGVGRGATAADFPLLGRGPFGDAVRIRAETDDTFRPTLLVPRSRLHGSGLDAKGPGRSVSLIAWVVRESGDHAIAGIWHEGTNLPEGAATRVEPGRRQYALFAGLAANEGAAAAHVSENGGASYGDRYARNLAVTRGAIPAVRANASASELDRAWHAAAFSFDNVRHTVTAYLDGRADAYWIEPVRQHPFFQWVARGWEAGQYRPPESKPIARTVLSTSRDERVEMQVFEFTKVRVTLRRDQAGRFRVIAQRELVALRVNPFWFGGDLYSPPSANDGGPFTIGRVIHSGRSVGFTGWIGGVAVFDRALDAGQMRRLAELARVPVAQ